MEVELLLGITFVGFLYLFIKHLMFDFYWQTKYQLDNKGTLGHYGGIQHAWWHTAASTPVYVGIWAVSDLPTNLIVFMTGWAILFEFTAHYWMDYYKASRCTRDQLNPTCSKRFWTLTGIDQFVHYLTYWFILFIWVSICYSSNP